MPRHSRSHRKQILLFLIAVILPSLILVVFTLRMISQERELSQKRIADERGRLSSEIGQHLLVRLEKIKLQEIGSAADWSRYPARRDYVNPEVVLIGLVDQNRLLLPWDAEQRSGEYLKLLSRSDFAQKIQRAEKEEFVEKNFLQAAELYRQAIKAAQEPVQQAYARLLLARILTKSGKKKEALATYNDLLALPSRITDEYGVPLSYYAAGRLLDESLNHREVSDRIQTEVGDNRWLPPPESYMLNDLIEKLIKTSPDESTQNLARESQRWIKGYIQKLEQSLALQEDFQTLISLINPKNQSKEEEPVWLSYGEESWLISLAFPSTRLQPFLVVVHAQDILSSLKQDSVFSENFPTGFHFITDVSSEGESLGPNFRGLRIAFDTGEVEALSKDWRFQPVFYLLALLLVLSVTLFGAYLLLRDVRREVRMAEMRSQFVSSVSHELKTPLTAIRMFAETLRLGRSKSQKAQEEYLDTIVSESQRLTRLLNNVLDFSKIEEGKRIYRPEPASLSEIIQTAARAIEYPLNQKGFKLHIHIGEGLPEVRVDRDAIEQAVLNLLHNAMKYSGASRVIDLRLQRKDSHALIQVIDRGVGIDPKEKERIFEKFYRVSSEENKRLPGTGLGLTLVSHIVKAHGGRIEVESEPGQGSAFSIYLPLVSSCREWWPHQFPSPYPCIDYRRRHSP
jgi:signal transduction histidine kinase